MEQTLVRTIDMFVFTHSCVQALKTEKKSN